MTDFQRRLRSINEDLEALLDSDDAGITSDTGATIENISARIHNLINAMTKPLQKDETAAILAALRLFQLAIERHDLPPMIEDIATDGGAFPPLNSDAIETLCESINTDSGALLPPSSAPLPANGQHPNRLEDVPVYALLTEERDPFGYTLQPSAHPGYEAEILSPDTQTVSIGLVAFSTAAEAQAFAQSFAHFDVDDHDLVAIAPDMHCVMIQFPAGTREGIAYYDHRRPAPARPVSPDDIKIYAVRTGEDLVSISGYSLDAKPGSAEPENTHVRLDPLDPGADLALYCFRRADQAQAFVEGLMFCSSDRCGTATKTFSPDLTAVLVEHCESNSSELIIVTDYLDQPSTP